MPETSPYPGSPSLSNEAREKVRQTFRHTIQLARSGRNEEALLGCDFILKMDARFQPARRLLETLRGVATGTIVDLTPFSEYADGSAPPAAAPAARHDPGEDTAASRRGGAAAAAPPPAPAKASLDDLAFDDFAMGESAPGGPGSARVGALGAAPPPRPAPAPPRPAPAMPAPQAAPPPPALGGGEFSLGEMPEAPPASMPSPFATLGPAVPAVPAPAPAAPFDTAPDAPSGAVDPRISQFLKQGDEALAKGQIQEAIDLWSRVFLIDLSNEEASQRIDAAREKQAETARRIDMLLSEGIHQYDAGDLAGARHKFLDVLALSESDSTARSYLNQIDAAIAEKSGPIAPAASSPAQPSFSQMGLGETPSSYGSDMDLGEPTATPSYESTPALEEGELEHVPSAAARKVRVDARVFLAAGLLVVVAVGAGVYFLLKKKEPVPAATQPPAAQRKQPGGPAAGDDAIARANVLLAQGKLEEARAIVTSIPDTDPRYPAALDVMERIKSAVVPTPGPATAVSAASLDEMRIAGIAASRGSRYIDAVKSLDPVVKARPEDVEAAEVLTKAREQVAAMGTAVKAYNEQDYQTAIRLFWDLHRKDTKNQDVEDFLFRSYFNDAIQDLQAGNSTKSADSFKEASSLRPGDAEAKRHLAFVRKYSKGATDLLARIYIKHLTPRP